LDGEIGKVLRGFLDANAEICLRDKRFRVAGPLLEPDVSGLQVPVLALELGDEESSRSALPSSAASMAEPWKPPMATSKPTALTARRLSTSSTRQLSESWPTVARPETTNFPTLRS
jgi:hypothetical protein